MTRPTPPPIGVFSLSRPPRIIFGTGTIVQLGSVAARFGPRTIVIAGASALKQVAIAQALSDGMASNGVTAEIVTTHGEPSPDFVDDVVRHYRSRTVHTVIAIGGGSAIDAGKAISAMLPLNESVVAYLEEVGNKKHPGCKTPFIAVPTTAGTGSEASANAVLSRIGPQGFKKSLRHEHLVPDVALIDPMLALSCPPEVTAACGMDALTQLIEAYVSPKASPITDALIEHALPQVRAHLIAAARNGANDLAARSGMAYAALVSGIALANAGLGVVHGLASPIGGLFSVPNGVVCGTLLLPAIEITLRELESTAPDSPALRKYARAGTLLAQDRCDHQRDGIDALLGTVRTWTEALRLPRLSAFGISNNDVQRIVAGAANKNNPVQLSLPQIAEIVSARL